MNNENRNRENWNRQKILIADDSEMNRAILADILEDEYEILEAEDGQEAVRMIQKLGTAISLVLLDIVMPNMDGFEVLAMMNKYKWIEDIPVIMISAENSATYVEHAYELGVTDYISRPFDALIVRRRAVNTIMLYAKQRKLIGMLTDQIYEREKSNSLMINILSHIVEFWNGESGLHVLHINTLTELLLKRLVQKTDQYHLDYSDIFLISTASALHDIGKIAIPGEILNKPGRLTREEFEVMKTHSMMGAKMLDELPFHREEALVKVAYEICRWHHERYDGRGYPDGLTGEEIPISAQVVAIADVYDALTSERVYKKAFPHEVAMQMIQNGECGAFNPLVVECLIDIQDTVQKELKVTSHSRKMEQEMRSVAEKLMQHKELATSERTLRQLQRERTKFQFFSSMTDSILFEYTCVPPMFSLSERATAKLGIPEVILDPDRDARLIALSCESDMHRFGKLLNGTTPEEPEVQFDCELMIHGKRVPHRAFCRSTWSDEEPPKYVGAIGKLMEISKLQEEKKS